MNAVADVGYWTGGITYTPAVGPATDLEFGVIDANGIGWVLNSFDGMGGPDTVGQVVQQAGDHGGWATPQYYAPRVMTLTLTASAPSQALRDVARATLQQAVPISDLALLRFDEPIPKQMSVRRTGALPEAYPALTEVQFSVVLVAPDPRKYGTVLHSLTANQQSFAAGIAPPLTPPLTLPAGSPAMAVACVNAGSIETRPAVTVQGPITGPGIVNQATGQTVSFAALTLGSTDVLVVDFLNKQATLNGAYRTADLASAWWQIPPGTTTVLVTGSGAVGAQMTVQWRDAWI